MYFIFAALVRIKKQQNPKAYWTRTFGSVYIKRYIWIIKMIFTNKHNNNNNTKTCYNNRMVLLREE